MEQVRIGPLVVEAEALVAMSVGDLADSLRTQSFHLMQAHPIAAAHLVLAAASIAPTCAAEQEVADEFSYLIADFALQLGILHQRELRRRSRLSAVQS